MRLHHSRFWLTLAVLVVGCGDDPPTQVTDTTPPARINDLAASHGSTGYFLTWTAPGDDDSIGRVATYELRRIRGDIAADWDDAIPIPPPASIVPAGQTQTAAIDSLGPGVWQFGVRAADEVPNWSDLSNVASLTISTPPTDSIPPAPVTDLAAEVTPEGVRLRWTAPGDDDQSGMATVYDLRFSLELITPGSFANATAVAGVGSPNPSGQPESVTVSNLQEGHEYFFALKSSDDVGNLSNISNVVTAFLTRTSPRQLTFNSTPLGATAPDWSPDGSKIACQMGVVGGFSYVSQVFVVPLNGGSPEQFTSLPSRVFNPDWAPDGMHFAVVEIDTDGSNYRIGVMEATPGAMRTTLASHSGFLVGSPKWSPDANQIAYRAYTNQQGHLVGSLYVVSVDGGSPTSLAGPFASTRLSWSPDGTMIAIDSNQSGSYDLWTIPAAGGPGTRVTMGTGDEYAPSWSPDGAVIAYVSDNQIWGIAPTGGPSFLLVNDTGVKVQGLTWSPDGRSIAYVKGTPSNIWVAGVNVQP